MLNLSGKESLNKKKFGKINSEVRGYGGRYVKGHWLIPLATFQETDRA